ncbi:hypothetical protein IE077_001315, partial [Cardiosporidium cionae]
TNLQHWKSRRTILGKPLLRMFWPQTNPNDISPFAVFRPRTKDKMTLRRPKRNQAEIVHKMEHLLEDFKRVEKILKKMKQRDEKKLLLLELSDLIFEQMRHEVNDPTYRVPQWEFLKETKFDKTARKVKKEKEKKLMEALQTIGITSPSPITHKKVIRQVRHLPLSSSPLPSPLHELEALHPRPQSFSPPPYTPFSLALKQNYLFPVEYIHSTTSPRTPYVERNFQLQIIRRRGRGGRIWLDRKRELLHNPTESNDPPPIASNLDSFNIFQKYDPFNRQQVEIKLLNSIETGEESLSPLSMQFSSFPPSGGKIDEEVNKRNQREALETYNCFRAWIKCTLPPNPTHSSHDLKGCPSGQRSGESLANSASTSAAMRSGGDVPPLSSQPPYAYNFPSSGFSHA